MHVIVISHMDHACISEKHRPTHAIDNALKLILVKIDDVTRSAEQKSKKRDNHD